MIIDYKCLKLKKERKFIIKLFKSKSQYIVIPISRWYKTVLYHWAIYFNLWSLNFQKYSAISYSCITLILNVVCDNTSGFRIWVVFSVALVSECHFLVIQTHITIKIWTFLANIVSIDQNASKMSLSFGKKMFFLYNVLTM